jgi:hypothetical protein
MYVLPWQERGTDFVLELLTQSLILRNPNVSPQVAAE